MFRVISELRYVGGNLNLVPCAFNRFGCCFYLLPRDWRIVTVPGIYGALEQTLINSRRDYQGRGFHRCDEQTEWCSQSTNIDMGDPKEVTARFRAKVCLCGEF
jgi:hypothetical protein